MGTEAPETASPSSANTNAATDLLEGLEALREELGSVADELILLLREAGVTPPPDQNPSAN